MCAAITLQSATASGMHPSRTGTAEHTFFSAPCQSQAQLAPGHRRVPSATLLYRPDTPQSATGTTFFYHYPILVFLFLAYLFCPRPALAETAPADTLQGPTPRGALLRSAILPGWGQYYNKRPFKALLFGTTAAGFLGASILESRSLGQAGTAIEDQDRSARRNTRVLLLIATSTFAALDAFVDAHLAVLEIEPELEIEPGRATLALKIPWEPR